MLQEVNARVSKIHLLAADHVVHVDSESDHMEYLLKDTRPLFDAKDAAHSFDEHATLLFLVHAPKELNRKAISKLEKTLKINFNRQVTDNGYVVALPSIFIFSIF